MSKRGRSILAVCDLEAAYACNFVEYIQHKKNIPFEVRAFTGVQPLLELASARHIDILLISDKAICEEVKVLDIGQIVILSEGVHDPALDRYPSVYKYQSSDVVIREVMNCYGAWEAQASGINMPKPKTRLLGVYSPVGRTAKTSFALTLGQILSRTHAVLYINLEEYAGFEQLLGCEYENRLGDLIYYIRQGNAGIALKIAGMVQTISNLDYLPPVLSPMDIQNTTIDEWLCMLRQVEENTAYDTVILDAGDGVNDLYTLLNQCETVYLPVRNDVMSAAKLQQFEQLLRMWDFTDLLERMQKVKLPYHRTLKRGKEYLDELVWSELGDYVKELLRNQKETGG